MWRFCENQNWQNGGDKLRAFVAQCANLSLLVNFLGTAFQTASDRLLSQRPIRGHGSAAIKGVVIANDSCWSCVRLCGYLSVNYT